MAYDPNVYRAPPPGQYSASRAPAGRPVNDQYGYAPSYDQYSRGQQQYAAPSAPRDVYQEQYRGQPGPRKHPQQTGYSNGTGQSYDPSWQPASTRSKAPNMAPARVNPPSQRTGMGQYNAAADRRYGAPSQPQTGAPRVAKTQRARPVLQETASLDRVPLQGGGSLQVADSLQSRPPIAQSRSQEARPATSHDTGKTSQKPKRTIEEEKEAMRALLKPQMPTLMPQDNAFPIFPTKRDAVKGKTRDSANTENGSRNSSEEPPRPVTAGAQPNGVPRASVERQRHDNGELPFRPSGERSRPTTSGGRHNEPDGRHEIAGAMPYNHSGDRSRPATSGGRRNEPDSRHEAVAAPPPKHMDQQYRTSEELSRTQGNFPNGNVVSRSDRHHHNGSNNHHSSERTQQPAYGAPLPNTAPAQQQGPGRPIHKDSYPQPFDQGASVREQVTSPPRIPPKHQRRPADDPYARSRPERTHDLASQYNYPNSNPQSQSHLPPQDLGIVSPPLGNYGQQNDFYGQRQNTLQSPESSVRRDVNHMASPEQRMYQHPGHNQPEQFNHTAHQTQPPVLDRDAEIEAEMPDFDDTDPTQAAQRKRLTIEQHLSDTSISTQPLSPPPMPSVPEMPPPRPAYASPVYQSQEYSPVPGNPFTPHESPNANMAGFVFNVPEQPAYQQPTSKFGASMPSNDAYDGQQGYQQPPYQEAISRMPPRSEYSSQSVPQQSPYQQPNVRVNPSMPQNGDYGGKSVPQQPLYHQPNARANPSMPQNGDYVDRPRAQQPSYAQGGYAPPARRPSQDYPQNSFGSSQSQRPMPQERAPYYEPRTEFQAGPQAMRGQARPTQPTNTRPSPPTQAHEESRQPMPMSYDRGAPQDPRQARNNPNALPQHPVPVRPGLVEATPAAAQAAISNSRPPPVRQYDNTAAGPNATASIQRIATLESRSSIDDSARSGPVTLAELDKLRSRVDAKPKDFKTVLVLVTRLVEAASVLASDNDRLDAKATAKNREKYILEAHKRLKKLVHAGYPDAMFYLADCYGQGSLGLEVDTKEAFTLYQSAAKAGHAAAAYRTAVCCELGPEEGGGTRKDVIKAAQWYRRAAQLQDLAAMYKLGIILLKGLLGQQRNIAEAVVWLKRAAERADAENPHALHELGILHEPGVVDPAIRDKVMPDEVYARELYTKAAQLGYKFSQFRLGQAYEYGSLGLPIDHRASIKWYSKAAAQGEHGAELALSGWYLTGAEGILEHSDTEAYLWARKAASGEPPLAKAMFAMGWYTEKGIGCPASLEEAKKWYGRAASYKFPKAIERLEEIRKGGTRSKKDPQMGRLRRDQKRDEAECVVM